MESEHENNQFVSTIFSVKKKDGRQRMVLNLVKVNEFVEYCHFKMTRLEYAVKLLTHIRVSAIYMYM